MSLFHIMKSIMRQQSNDSLQWDEWHRLPFIRDVRPISIGRKGKERYFLYPVEGDIGDIQGKKVLIVEDDVPTGKSVKMTQKHLLVQAAKEVKIACVFKNKEVKGIDFFAQEMKPKSFPTYPWKTTNLGDRTS